MSSTLTVVCCKWAPFKGYRSSFGPETVNVLRRMVARHYPDPHRFVCCTDDPKGIDKGIEIVTLWNDHADLQHPQSSKAPSCYRRLKMFAPEMRQIFGERFVSLDLDCVILGDLRPLWNRPEDFVGWGGTNETTTYNGSMFLLRTGSRAQVWKEFNPVVSPDRTRQAGLYGTDQAWISYLLGPNEPRWSETDGVYSYRLHVLPNGGTAPENAKIIFFNGKFDPWSDEATRLPWVRNHYQ